MRWWVKGWGLSVRRWFSKRALSFLRSSVLVKANICFTLKHTLTDEGLFLPFHIFMISFHHVLNCGLVSYSNISSILFQYNHSLDLKHLKIALTLDFLRLPTVGSRNWTVQSNVRLAKRAGCDPLLSRLYNNPKVLLPGGLYVCMTSLSPKCLSICFSFPWHGHLKFSPGFRRVPFKATALTAVSFAVFYKSVNSCAITYDGFCISAEKVCNLHL